MSDPNLTVYDQLEQGSSEWLQARAGIVTASVVGQLLSPKTLKPADNDTSRALTRTLVAERITGRAEESYETRDMLRGTLSEPHAREEYEKATGAEVEQVGFLVRSLPGLRIGFSPDGLIGDNGILEIKSPKAKVHLNTVLTDAVPSVHLPQVHAGMLVSDREWADFVSYHPGLPLFIKRVYRDDAWDQAIIDTVAAFEDRAEQMIRDYHKATAGRPPTPYVDVFDEEVSLTL